MATAVRLMRAEGLQRVTMRRLAQELDTGAASLYVYVANTAELHAAILEDLLGGVDLRPAGGEGDWRDRLVALLDSYTRVLFQHSALAGAALVARPTGPNYLALLEAILALLHEGGMPDEQAAWAVDVLLQLATATAAEQSVRAENEAAAQEDLALMEAVRGADDAAHPRLAAVGEKLFAGPPEQRLSWMFHAVINGALATPRVSER